jgi:oligopeptide transport system permease protein
VLKYVLRRLFGAVLVVFAVFTLSFVIMRISPGSPFDQDRELPPEVVSNQAETTGMAMPVPVPTDAVFIASLVQKNAVVDVGQPYASVLIDGAPSTLVADAPFTVFRVIRRKGDSIPKGGAAVYRHTDISTQYLTTLSNYMSLDFGVTFDSRGQRTVWENIVETLPVSMELGFYALIVALVFGVSSGLIAGLRQNSWMDHTVMSAAMVGISLPSIVLGPLLILIFIMKLQWLPPYGGWEGGLGHGWEYKILPSIALGLVYAAYFARLTRGGMLDVVRQDWIRTARAKGLSDTLIVRRHALRGAILPTVTFLGPAIAHLMVGSVVVEKVFKIPGVSKYFVDSAINRDYPMVMGVVIVYSIFLVLFNLLVDVAYAYLDPRVKYE